MNKTLRNSASSALKNYNPDMTYPNFGFEITHQAATSRARIGKLKTPHGTIETPNYIFCGTKASIKNLSPAQMEEAQTDIILANTYHLMIQPGAELVEKMGGLHKFMNWNGPLLTDSGGFQVFSMGHGTCADEIKGRSTGTKKESLLKITEEGAFFKSYHDGSKLVLSPETSMKLQRQLGADLIMQMDECTAYQVTRDYTAKSMEMSMRWGDRSLAAFETMHDGSQGLYGIVQGGIYHDLRQESAKYVASRPFFGTAIGGCLGGSDEEMYGILESTAEYNHPDRPIHFLGIGRIKDVLEGVKHGIDTFDCVMPTRIARHGMALIKGAPNERINLMNSRYKDDPSPLDERMDIACSRDYSKAYIHHLFKANEMLAYQIVTQHNVAVINQLMREVREGIKNDCLDDVRKEWLGE